MLLALSGSYEIDEDASALERETLEIPLQASENDTLGDELEGTA